MATNKINYLSRDFDSIKKDIIAYSKANYPQLSDGFGNDGSITQWIIDLLSDCADSLNYQIDRVYQDTQINSSTSKSAILNIARSNGLKVPGRKASMCEVQFSCWIPAVSSNNISSPKWDMAPKIQRNCIVGAGNISYTIDENVDFGEQFNSMAFSNRTYSPRRDANGGITGYIVTKSVVATAGQRKVYKKILTEDDVHPFMEVILPDVDVMNVESIIFKASSNINSTPEISEYYVDSEQYIFRNQSVTTYRFFETDSLSDQWRWGSPQDSDLFGDVVDSYEDYVDGERITRVYKGEWKPLRQKFITEYTDNGYMKIIFGPGVEYTQYPSGASNYAKYRMCEIMNNDMLGVLPKVGWTMYVLYNTGGGVNTNVGVGAINTINSMQVDFRGNVKNADKSQIMRSISVTNLTPAIAGKDAPSTDELKYLVKYNTGAQDRCVTVKDYEHRLMMMPPKYGTPFRCAGIEENNKIVLSVLNMNSDGTLYKALPNVLADNIEKYLKGYKSLCDYVEIKSGKIYNIGFMIDAFVDKSYNSADVIASIIRTTRDYMDVNKHQMGVDVFIGDLYKEISVLDGVIGLIDLKVYKIWNGGYSNDKCPLPSIADNTSSECSSDETVVFKVSGNADCERIDIDAVESVLISDCNSMYEIKNPDIDIQVRIKTR